MTIDQAAIREQLRMLRGDLKMWTLKAPGLQPGLDFVCHEHRSYRLGLPTGCESCMVTELRADKVDEIRTEIRTLTDRLKGGTPVPVLKAETTRKATVITGRGEQLAISAESARLLTDRIKTTVEVAWQLLTEAYTSRAWAALGYDSWDAYCTAEFGTSRLRLPREERMEVVGSLRDAGLSTRAIASATGVNRKTVMEDLHVAENPQVVRTGPPDPTPITGTDGKTYTPTPTSKPRRRPWTDAYDRAVYDLGKVSERLERLAEDDRADRHREHAQMRLHALADVINTLTNVLDDMEVGNLPDSVAVNAARTLLFDAGKQLVDMSADDA